LGKRANVVLICYINKEDKFCCTFHKNNTIYCCFYLFYRETQTKTPARSWKRKEMTRGPFTKKTAVKEEWAVLKVDTPYLLCDSRASE